MNKSVVNFEHVNFSYQDTPVLRDVSFTVQEKEFVGIIGPNGGGKTTMLKLIMGFLKPNSGKIQVFDKSPKNALSSIAYVPQTARFDKQFPISVMELVLSGRLSSLAWHGQYSSLDKAKALDALSKVSLLELKNQAFGMLSGGQAQRALIARAIVSEPKLLLLDEPTASVDAQAEADIYNILTSLNEQMTIMMVTHDLGAVVNKLDKVILVQGGVTTLTPKEVCEHFAVGLYHGPLIKISN